MRRRLNLIVAVLIAALVLAGCGPLGRQPTAEEVVQRMEAALEGLASAHAVVELSATREDETINVVTESWMQRDAEREDTEHSTGRLRVEVLSASEPDAVGSLAVSNGESGWLYNPSRGKALHGERAALEAWQAEQGDDWAEAPADLGELEDLVGRILEISEVTLVGEETIAERRAWHVRLTPNEEAPQAWQVAGGTVELWVDQASELPLQVSYSGGPEAAGEARVTVQELEENPAIAPERFEWSPPEGTEVVEVATLLPERMTLPEARAEAPFHLLSTGADNAAATLVELFRQGDRYVQKFDGTAGEWTLIQGPAKERDHDDAGTATTVRGVGGRLWSDAERGQTLLTWTEDGASRTITGQLSAEDVVALAESLE